MTDSQLPKIFITHAWADIAFARRLYNDLIARGFEAWFDDKTLQAGHRMAEEINRGLAWCDVYIPIISRASLASKWCDEEINAAISLNVEGGNAKPRIISAFVEDCRDELKKRYPSLVARLYINFAGRQYAEAWQELLRKGFGLTQSTSISDEETISEIEREYQAGIHGLILGQFEVAVMSLRRVVDRDKNYKDAPLKLRKAEQLLAEAEGARPPIFKSMSAGRRSAYSLFILLGILCTTLTLTLMAGSIALVGPPQTTSIALLTQTVRQTQIATPTLPPVVPMTAQIATSTHAAGRIAFSVNQGDRSEDKLIWIMGADGTDAKKILDRASGPTFSPDGTEIAYYHWTDGIYISSTDGTNPRKLVDDMYVGFIEWSHDGRWIAFSSQPGGTGSAVIDLIAPDGTARPNVTIGENPSWSPDDTQLVFDTCRGAACGIYKANVSGSDTIPILIDDGGLPAWSPDGKKIVYQKEIDGQMQLFSINPDGSGRKQLAFGSTLHVDGAWSLDGKFIFYRSPEGGSWGVWRMNADGSNPVKLIDNVPPVSWLHERLAVTR